ncbi:hypothetical protein [Pseudochryseolinea flava]|uniref:Uncharacterized protein n=1 Tax=Pseudochryseolinea flava TaxID=2059302 RepID=A0A364Y268_9BACT|nr:hypothetical protein [Pseudochryseolinea flava]RAW00740.1 hypothetical protein DQQ10_14270 [Pseudochryseolinea flava]
MKKVMIILGVFCAVAVAVFVIRKKSDQNISISIAESRDAIALTVSYPEEKSAMVHDYIREQMKADLPDLIDAFVNHPRTTEEPLQFELTSSDGDLKIVMDKNENSSAACRHLKQVGNEIGAIVSR